eukprot:2075996-Pyramimonas_sp.AAC.1
MTKARGGGRGVLCLLRCCVIANQYMDCGSAFSSKDNAKHVQASWSLGRCRPQGGHQAWEFNVPSEIICTMCGP